MTAVIGQIVAEGLDCSKNTVHDYLGYLEDAYMVESMFIETALISGRGVETATAMFRVQVMRYNGCFAAVL